MTVTDHAWLSDPNKWARWPFIPLKRDGEVAVLMDAGNDRLLLWENCNFWGELPSADEALMVTVDQVLALGWRVD